MNQRYSILLTESAERDLGKLDTHVAKRIISKLRTYEADESPFRHAKQLKGPKDTYRFRIGDYRAIFEVQSDGTPIILVVLCIRHRKDVYR